MRVVRRQTAFLGVGMRGPLGALLLLLCAATMAPLQSAFDASSAVVSPSSASADAPVSLIPGLLLSAEAAIHRHASYTLWPVKMPGRRHGTPEDEVRAAQGGGWRNRAAHQPQQKQPQAERSSLRRRLMLLANETGGAEEQDDPDAHVDPSGAGAGGGSSWPGGSASYRRVRDRFYNASLETVLAMLEKQDRTRARTRVEKLPLLPEPGEAGFDPRALEAEDDEPLPSAAEEPFMAQAAMDRRAQFSVTKLNLWQSTVPESDVAPLQHGHLIRLENPLKHFSFFPPKDGCGRAESPEASLEKPSSNGRRHRCHVVTNAGFFNTVRRRNKVVRHCYGGLVERHGRLVQKSHSRLRSRQLGKHVHFGITSSGHFFVGYLTEELWRAHLRPGNKMLRDVDDSAAPLATDPHDNSPAEAALPPEYDDPSPRSNNSWSFETLVGGALWLVRDGRDYVMESLARDREDMRVEQSECGGEEAEKVCKKDPSGFFARGEHFVHLEAARTAIGHTEDGSLIILSVDGTAAHPEHQQRAGITLRDMAALLVEYGAINAIGLDGGGSASVVVENVVSNYPSDTAPTGWWGYGGHSNVAAEERAVSSVACIHDDDEDEQGQVMELDERGRVVGVKNPPEDEEEEEEDEDDEGSTSSSNSTSSSSSTAAAGAGATAVPLPSSSTTGSSSSSGRNDYGSSSAGASAGKPTAERVDEMVLVNATAHRLELDDAVQRATDALRASAAAHEAEVTDRFQRSLFVLQLLVPILGVALLVSLLCVVYCACVRGWGPFGSASALLNGDNASAGADDPELAGSVSGGPDVPRSFFSPGRTRKGGFRRVGAEGDMVDSPPEQEHHDASDESKQQPDELVSSTTVGASAIEQLPPSAADELELQLELGGSVPPPSASSFPAMSTSAATRAALARSSLDDGSDSVASLALNGPLAAEGASLAQADALAAQIAAQAKRNRRDTSRERRKLAKQGKRGAGAGRAAGEDEEASMGGLLAETGAVASSNAASAFYPPLSQRSPSPRTIAASPSAGGRFELGDDLGNDGDEGDEPANNV